MTSPAIFVLCVALVCSVTGTASHLTADHGFKLIKKDNNINTNMKIRTNNYIPYNDNLSSKHIDLDKNVYEDIFVNNQVNDMKSNIDNVNFNVDGNIKIDKTNVGKSVELQDIEIDNSKKFENVKFIINNNVKFKDTEMFNPEPSLILSETIYHGQMRQYDEKTYMNKKNKYRNVPKRRVKREDDECEGFKWESGVTKLQSPLSKNSSTSKDGLYASNVDCYTVIRGQTGQQVVLTFINEFHIEYHPTCNYDYIQIRDGEYGYAKSLGKFCGNAFPQVIHSSGPYLWLKFHSDSTIEYVGFQIQIDLIEAAKSRPIPSACMKEVVNVTNGVIDTSQIDPDCKKFVSESESRGLDVVWKITTAADTKIYLNFTAYNLAKPNECEENYIQIFGRELEEEKRLAIYCGSVANAVNSQDNIMYIRMYTSKTAEKGSTFNATFNAYRQLDPNKDNDVCREDEFDCEDNTCIDGSLKCNEYANCRLKTDEDKDTCKGETTSKINEPHIMVILVIFSLILSGMSFVFLFKCIRKLYQDHKIIKEHISQSCEDRLDNLLADSRFPLDAKKLQRTSEPRASLERENHTNEMFKKQRSFSQRKRTSIDSDYIQETPLDLDDEPWQRNVESAPIEAQDIKIERNGRSRRSEMSKREESIRSKKESKEIEEREKKEIRDVSVGAPDTKESGCQTRESLFQADTAPSSDGSNGTNSRGFSTFGYSGATIVRPSPPAPSNTSQITLELLKQVPQQDPIKSQKKIPDRRPMSAETTRSAPDVIIVSKPIR